MSTGSVRSCPGDGTPSVVTSVTFKSLFSAGRPDESPGRRARDPGPAGPGYRSDVEEPDVLGVALDERTPGLDVFTHQHAEQLVRLGRVIQRHLKEPPVGRVHGGFPQLGRVHLTETLEPLYPVAGTRVLLARRDAGLDQQVPLGVAVGVLRLVAAALPLDLVQRRLGQVHMTGLDQWLH